MNKTIILDVDLVLTNPIPLWIAYMNDVTGLAIDPFREENYNWVDYNITKYWGNAFKEKGKDPFDFWRDKYLYDKMLPLPWSQNVLERLHEKGYTMGCSTHCKGYSAFSKHRFVKKYYPFISFFNNTQEKWATRGDVLIDDRRSNLASMPDNVKLVQMMSPYKQEVDIKDRAVLQYTWTMGVAPLEDFINE